MPPPGGSRRVSGDVPLPGHAEIGCRVRSAGAGPADCGSANRSRRMAVIYWMRRARAAAAPECRSIRQPILHRQDAVVRQSPVVVACFGDDVTLERFIGREDRHVELCPDSYNPEHRPIAIDLARHVPYIDSVAVGTLIDESLTDE